MPPSKNGSSPISNSCTYSSEILQPPGPLPFPIVGNTFQLPDNKPWIYFEELSKRYNTPLITFWIGRNPTVWINDAWAASDILEKRAGIYCSRPRMLVFAELGSGQNNLVNMITTTPEQRDRWRIQRKITHQGVGVQKVREYRSFQNDESKVVAYDMLKTPEEYVAHFERYATSVVSIIGFGRRVSDHTDPIISEVIAVMHRAADLNVPGKTFPMLLETFPRSYSTRLVNKRNLLTRKQFLQKYPTRLGSTAWENEASPTVATISSILSHMKPTRNRTTRTATPNSFSEKHQSTILNLKRFLPCLGTSLAPDPTRRVARSSPPFSLCGLSLRHYYLPGRN